MLSVILKLISSIKDPAFEELRRNRTVNGRREFHTFVIENEEMIAQAVEAGFALKAVYAAQPLSRKLATPNLYEISQGMMAKVFSNETPGVAALAFKKETFLSKKPLLLVLDQIQNCNNMGMILRSAEAFGVEGVIVIPHPTADLYDRNVIKASMGSFFRLPITLCSADEAIEFLKKNKINIISTVPDTELTLEAVGNALPAALVVGNETHGVSDPFIRGADTLISIPMKGKIQSLNVVVAASLCLYHWGIK